MEGLVIMGLREIKRIIVGAVNEFNQKDKNILLKNRVNETTASHRIAVYLENKFPSYSIDCEYNKTGNDPKLNSENKRIRPDIIVHKREDVTRNDLVVIELKLAGKDSQKGKKDIDKLKKYLEPPLNYKLGVFIGVLKRRIDICWITKNSSNFEIISEVITNESKQIQKN